MPKLKPNNPAARLYLILGELRGVGTNPNTNVKAAWSQALGTSQDGKLQSQIGMVLGLPRDIKKQLQRCPYYDAHEVSWWKTLSQGLTQFGLREQWGNVASAITPDIMGAIRSNARKLNEYLPESVLKDSVIEELREQITQLRSLIKDEAETDTDENLIEFIAIRLEYMEDLLDDIKIVGAIGVKHGFENVVSEVQVKAEEVKREVHPQTWDKLDQLMKRVQAVCLTITLMGGATATTTAGVRMLTSGAPQIENTQTHTKESPRKELPPAQDDDEPTDTDFKNVSEST